MATALQHMTECPVCYVDYKDPKLLPCDHSLCKSCVDRIKRGSTIKCPVCNQSHDVIKIKADFRLQQFLDALKEEHQKAASTVQSGDIKCGLCSVKHAAHWCEECDQWMCKDCLRIHSSIPLCRNHTFVPLAAKNQEVKDAIEHDSKEILAAIEKYSSCVKKIQSALNKLECIQHDSLQVSDSLRKKALKEINDFFDSLDARIIDFIHENISQLQNRKETLDKQLREIEQHWQILSSMIKENEHKLVLEGKDILQRIKELSIVKTNDLDVTIEDASVSILQEKAWNASAVATLELHRGQIKSARDDSFDIDLSTLVNRQLTLKCKQSLQYQPFCIRLINQKLWTCQERGTIQIFNDKLEHEHAIVNEAWGTVYDVTEMLNGTVVLASLTGLIHVNCDGRDFETIEQGKFTTVAYNDHKLYSCQMNSNKIDVYEHGRIWKKTGNISNPFDGGLITLSVSNDKIVCCAGRRRGVYVLSLAGSVLQKYVAYNKVRFSYFCQQDRNGTCLIADSDGNSLHVIDGNGRGQTLNLKPSLDLPRRALYRNNKVFVATCCPSIMAYE